MQGASIEDPLAKHESAPVAERGSVIAFPARRVPTTADQG